MVKMYRILLVLVLIFLVIGSVEATGNEEALKAIKEAENAIEGMEAMDFGITYANDTLNEAKGLFDQGYYEASESLAKKVLEIKEKAIEVDELINQVEAKIYELSSRGYDTSDVSVIFDSGISEFMVDNYLDAEKFMRDALNRLDELEAEESLKRIRKTEFDFVSIVLDYLWVLVIMFLFVTIAGFKVKKKVNTKKWEGELGNLEREMEEIKKSLAETQRKYFEKGLMSRMDYDLMSKRYNHRLSLIKRKTSVLNENLKNH